MKQNDKRETLRMTLPLAGVALLAVAGLLAGPAAGEAAALPADPPAADAGKAVEASKPAAAPGPVQLKVGDAVFRFGTLIQAQADWTQDPVSSGYAQNLFIRRIRFIVGGQVTKNVVFYFQTENSNLGKVNASGTKVISTGLQVLDASAEWRIAKEFNLWGGLFYAPTSREAMKSASSEFELDTSAYATLGTAALAGTGGRDTGFMARGYFLADRLEYRVGVFQGLRDTSSRNSFRTVTRLQYNVFDPEPYVTAAYTASYFGKKKILAIGAAYDTQKDYQAYSADVYADFPVPFGSVVATGTYQNIDGGTTVASLPKEQTYQLEAGVFFKEAKIGPWARWERRNTPSDGTKTENRYLVGINYYVYGTNLNLKAAYGRVEPKVVAGTNQFTLQLQAFYF